MGHYAANWHCYDKVKCRNHGLKHYSTIRIDITMKNTEVKKNKRLQHNPNLQENGKKTSGEHRSTIRMDKSLEQKKNQQSNQRTVSVKRKQEYEEQNIWSIY